jgi:plastocyanin
MKRLFLGLGLVALAAVATACSGATAAPATDAPAEPAPAGDAIVIVAKDLQFQTAAVTVPAGKPVEIVLDNQEGAPHNIAVKDAAATEVFKGEIVSSSKVSNAIPALAAGTYTFWCEVHPSMQGTITAQ